MEYCLLNNISIERFNTHPLLVQFEELLRDSGWADGQTETLDVQLRNHVLQHLLQRETTGHPVPRRGGHSVLQDRPAQGS